MEITKIVTGEDGYILELGEHEEATKETLEELSNGKGEEEDEQ